MNPRPPVWPAVVSVIAIVIGSLNLLILGGITVGAGVLYSLGAGVQSLGDGAQSASSDTQVDPPTDLPVLDGTVEGFYSQPVQWNQCASEQIADVGITVVQDIEYYSCAWLQAPKDWNDPAGEVIVLSIAKYVSPTSTGQALFYNLGGPGGAAVKSLASQVSDNLGQALLDNFDIVALDPRGVGASTPVICMSDAERDAYQANSFPDKDADDSPETIVAFLQQQSRDYAAGCEKYSGDLYKYVDTVSAARDFDMARALLNQDQLHYLGYSYGTFLGAIYADLFPDKVGRFVLDGAVDPAVDVDTISELQMRGFEASLRHWAEDCLTGADCPVQGSVDDAMEQLHQFLSRLEERPIPTSDSQRPLTQSAAFTAVVALLYSTDTYGILSQALTQALNEDDGSTFLYIADLINERGDDGVYTGNSADALIAVNNLDYSPVGTVDEWTAQAKKLEEELTVMGPFAGWTSASVEAWPTQHAQRQPVTAEGAAPIVVVGTTHDPATPYVMAESLAQQLSSGVLVTWEGWDHTAYSAGGSTCVAQAVEGYFVEGKVPADGTMCTD